MMTDAPRAYLRPAGILILTLSLAACGTVASQPGAPVPTATPTSSAAAASVSATWELDGDDLLVHVEVSGFDVRFVPGDTSGGFGHLHLFVDRPPVEAGGQIGFDEGIVHTNNREIRVRDLAPGSHTVWVVVADGEDIAFDPLVATRIDVTID